MILDQLAPYRKSIGAAVLALAAALLTVIPSDGGLGDLTVAQWLTVVVLVLTPAAVFAVPNDKTADPNDGPPPVV